MSAYATSLPMNSVALTSMPKFWTGRILTGLSVLFLIFDGLVKFTTLPAVLEANARLGMPQSAIVPIGIVELACTILYLIPRASVLGAVLLTGYLGGATAMHVRIGDNFFFPIVFGVLVWSGLLLRSSRIRQFITLLYR